MSKKVVDLLERFETEKEYWADKLSGNICTAALYHDFDGDKNYKCDKHILNFDREMVERLLVISKNQDLSLYVILVTVYKILLYKYTSQRDIVIASPILAREEQQRQVNFVLLRDVISPELTFKSALMSLSKTVSGGYKNQYYPLKRVAKLLETQDTLPLLKHVFSMENIHGKEFIENAVSEIQSDLITCISRHGDELSGCVYFNSGLLKKETVGKLFECYINILRQVLSDTNIKLSDIKLVSEEEERSLLYEFDSIKVEYNDAEVLHSRFEEQVRKTPSHEAVCCTIPSNENVEFESLTYEELNEKADKIALLLKEKGIKPNKIVGLMVERSICMVYCILGILKSGGAYLPIDPDYPAERINYMLKDSGAALLLTRDGINDSIDENEIGMEIAYIEDAGEYKPNRDEINNINKATDLAYIIYTSGSTGMPKGVAIEHKGVLNYTNWRLKEYGYNGKDLTLQIISASFDGFASNFYSSLLTGGSLVLIDSLHCKDFNYIKKVIDKKRITNMSVVPGMYRGIIENSERGELKTLRFVVLAGEKASPELVKKSKLISPSTILINEYGPTENTVTSTALVGITPEMTSIIGKPISNCNALILNSDNNLMPVGVPGELCLSGLGLAREYVNRPELTAEKFTENPFQKNGRMYKTGDIARWLPDGNIHLIGRVDNQVKVRGYRIELQEIENAILKQEGIKEVAVLAKTDQNGNANLYAYISSEEKISFADLKKRLSKELPDYMVPQYYKNVSEFPLMPNGKVDMSVLGKVEAEVVSDSVYAAPSNEIEQELIEIWKKILELKNIGVNDNFFNLGGHSLKATTLLSVVHRRFNVEIPLKVFFEKSTVKDSAKYIMEHEDSNFVFITQTEKRPFYPISLVQKRLFILNQFEGADTIYNMPLILEAEGCLDRERLEKAAKEMVKRHDAFRTSFKVVDGEMVQFVQDEADFAVNYTYIGEHEINECIEAFIRPFDLSSAPLLRLDVLIISEKRHILMFDTHHIVSDGASMAVASQEFMKLYQRCELQDLKIQYKDYAIWQSDLCKTEYIKKQKEYWLDTFKGELPVLNLPTDFPRPNTQSFEGNFYRFKADRSLTGRLHDLARELSVTPYMVLLAGFTILMSKYSSQEDIIIGSPVEGRSHEGLENIIGMFVNVLPMRNRPVRGKTVKTFLEEVRDNAIKAFENQLYQFEELITRNNMSSTPLYNVIFEMTDAKNGDLNLKELSFKPYVYKNRVSVFDISLHAQERENEFYFEIEYSTSIFKAETIEKMAYHFVNILKEMITYPEKQIFEIDMLSPSEKTRLLYAFSDTKKEYADNRTFHELFEEQVRKTPDKTAVLYGSQSLTYMELNRKANQVAHFLRHKGIKREDIVGIMLDVSLERIVYVLGALKAGAAYLPIDVDYPEERVLYMIRDSRMSALLSDKNTAEKLGAIKLLNNVITTNNIDSSLLNEWCENPDIINASADLAYIIYTSGTTGNPKGVMIEHRSLVNVSSAWTREYRLDEMDVKLLQMASFSFDVFTGDMSRALLNGGTMILCNKDIRIDPPRLYQLMNQCSVNIFEATPALILPLMEYIYANNLDIDFMKLLILGSDICPTCDFKKLLERFGSSMRIINSYGVTEAAIDSGYYEVSAKEVPLTGNTPIGKPLQNTKFYIFDKDLRPQPVGVYGELYIAGDGLARGYINNEEMTNQRFLYSPVTGHERVYKTGDAARWLYDGNVEFQGRTDNQVKIRGYRIELGEIEAQLLNYPAVKEAVVIARKEEQQEPDICSSQYLCAYIVSDEKLDTSLLREFISKVLANYMIPSYYIQIDKMPLSPNGKVDRNALSKIDINLENDSLNMHYEPASDTVEIKLMGIWQQVLGRRCTDVNENFFEAGGHSLKATVLVARISKEFNCEVPLRELFKTPSIKGIAAYIRSISKGVYTSIKPAEEKEYYMLSSAQRRLYVINRFEGVYVSYNTPFALKIEGELDKILFEAAFRKLIKRHEALRTTFELKEGVPVQVIHKEIPFEIEYIENCEERTEQIIKRFIRPFELDKLPLIRAGLLKLTENVHILLIDMHHIITDGVSANILQMELMQLYNRKNLPELKFQYKDYSEWQNELIESSEMKKQEEYWLRTFSGELPVLNMTYDYPRPRIQNFEGDTVLSEIDGKLLNELYIMASKTGTTLYMLLLAAYNVLLFRYTGQEDIIVGTPIAGRQHPEFENIIGMFVNTLAIRSFPESGKTFKEFLMEVREKSLQAYENQEYQFNDLIEKLKVSRNVSRNPLFDSTLVLHNTDINSIEHTNLAFSPFEFERGISKFDLSLSAYESDGRVLINFEYCTKLFRKETIERMATHFINILKEAAGKPEIMLGEIQMLSDNEKSQLLFDFNNTAAEYPYNMTLHQIFEKQVLKAPESIALVYEGKTLTYSQLNEKAGQLAVLLRDKGVKPNSVVGLMLERSPEVIISMLGILKAGGAYLPLDTLYPQERVISMLNDSGASVLVSSEESVKNFSLNKLQGVEKNAVIPYISSPRAHIKDFDSLPIPDRSLVCYEKYENFIGLAMVKHTVAIQATRGCPYNCAYCHKIWPKTHVIRTAENIYNEIKVYYDMGIRRFIFIDDIFNLNVENSSELFNLIIDNGLNIHIFFPNGVRGDLLTKEYIDLMVRAGTVNISLALETASPRLQKLINKNLNLQRLRENIEYITEKYPHVILDLFAMHGFPTESTNEARSTLEFIKSIKWLHFPYFHILKIYPGTDMAVLAAENGMSEEAIENSVDLAFHDLPETLPFPKHFTHELQSEFLNEYFLLKERLLKVLPVQMRILTQDELVQKYNSYLPVNIKSFSDLLKFAGIERTELGDVEFIDDSFGAAADFDIKLKERFPKKKHNSDALRMLFLDLSQLFGYESDSMLYDVVEPPLGHMYLLTYLNKKFGVRINGKIAKSRIDFNSYDELKKLIDEFKPDVIGIRTLTFYRDFFHKTVSIIRQWGINAPIIAGGPYATSDYRNVLRDRNVDLVILGEGEITLGEVIEKMIDNKKLPEDSVLRTIDGVAFVEKGATASGKSFGRDIVWVDHLNDIEPVKNNYYIENVNSPEDLAYIIYTSGSTGRPKGVMINHRNVVRLMLNNNMQFDFTENDVWTMFHSYCFDFSVWEMYGALLYGGRLVIVPKLTAINFKEYLHLLKKERVTVLNAIPSVFYSLMDEELKDDAKNLSLRYVIFGGEALKPSILKPLRVKYPDTRLINMYGITETTVHVTYKEITEAEIEAGISNIGKPIPTTTAYIMDKNKNIVPIGVIGELCVGGAGVGLGYINNPELTSEKFIQNPYKPDERLYLSGDYARFLQDGDIEYTGRIDHQVKIRGFRIETGDIECCLLRNEKVKGAIVIDKTDENGYKYLSAYVVSKDIIPVTGLRDYLLKYLPEYMIPSYFIHMDSLPLTSNGKVDRFQLPEAVGFNVQTEFAEARNKTDEKLMNICKDILGVKNINITDNFFNIGGNSIRIMLMIAKIYDEFGIDISLKQIYESPSLLTVSDLIDHAERLEEELRKPDVILLNKKHKNNIFAFPALAGYGIHYTELANLINSHSFYAFNFIESENRIAKYADIITEIQKEDPYIILGYSAGGNLAFEVAKELINRSKVVSDIIMLDALKLTEQDITYSKISKEQINSELNKMYDYFINKESSKEIVKQLDIVSGHYIRKVVIDKMTNYFDYLSSLKNNGEVESNIHLICAKSDSNDEESNKLAQDEWGCSTTKKFIKYCGHGLHGEMLDKSNICVNKEIIDKILELAD